ncbi:hypothetical protein A2U01_0082507, partial [Trifolium medium]|nr:hypothetical protein [Trifolium medium]
MARAKFEAKPQNLAKVARRDIKSPGE